jgi:putative hydrolase of the HAD superfamily
MGGQRSADVKTDAAVLFDFGGTLDSDGVRWSVRFHAAYRAGGGSLEFPAFEPLFRRSDSLLAADPRVRALGFHALVEAQAELLARLLPDGAALDPAALAEPFYAESLAVVGRNRGILERLRRRYALGVVSNFSGNLVPVLTELELLDYFRCIADSGVLGIQKPDPAIFHHALRELRVPARACWLVGDHPGNDIAPALQLQLRGCWLAPAGAAPPVGVIPSARITTLPELELLLA